MWKNRFSLIIIALFISGTLSPIGNATNISFSQHKQLTFLPMGASTSHTPIRINDNGDFIIGQNGVTGGSGTKSDPFLIMDWHIDATGTNNYNAVYIGNTTVCFTVKNCQLQCSKNTTNPFFYGAGVSLCNVKNGIIKCNNITKCKNGIFLYYSNINTISYNNISDNSWRGLLLEHSDINIISNNLISNDGMGVHLKYSNKNMILVNTIFNNTYSGIYPEYWSNSTIIDKNIISYNSNGIMLGPCTTNNIISNNFITNSIYTGSVPCYGIYMDITTPQTIWGNAFQNDGIFIKGTALINFIHIIPQNNTVNGFPLYYYSNQSGGNLKNKQAGQLILVNCSNFDIDGINASGTIVGGELAFCSYVSIKNSTFSNNCYGLNIDFSNNSVFSENDISNNNDTGVNLFGMNNLICNSIISNNKFAGIDIRSNLNTISNNLLFNNSFAAIMVEGSVSGDIYNNTITSNPLYGIFLDAVNTIISNNNITNSNDGIYIYNAYNVSITTNNFFNNTAYAVTFDSDFIEHNYFHHNNFILNHGSSHTYNAGHIQARGYNGKNSWNTSNEGNFWLDWTEPDSDNNGIVDSPYWLQGGAEDYYPLTNCADTLQPGRIADLIVSNATIDSLLLTWTAPANNGTDPKSGNASGYDIRYTASGAIVTNSDFRAAIQCIGVPSPGTPGIKESFNVTGLKSSTTYYFSMKTKDKVPNWADLSNSVSGTTCTPPDITSPAKVIDLAAGNPTQTSITLNWTAPANNGNDVSSGNASLYDIRYLTGSTPITDLNWNLTIKCTGVPVPGTPGSLESFVVTGLTPNTQYHFALKTADSVPNWSNISNSPTLFTSIVKDTTPPETITDLISNNPTQTSITLHWTAPANNGTNVSSGKASLYDIRYLAGSMPITDLNWNLAVKCTGVPVPGTPGSLESFVVTGLTPNTQYHFAIKTADGVPNWSNISNSPNAFTSSLKDTIPPAKVIDLTAGNPTQTSITLTWTAPANNGTDLSSGNASQYDIRYIVGSIPIIDSNWNLTIKCTGVMAPGTLGTLETFNVTNLLPNTQYYFAMKTADGVPNWSNISNSPETKTLKNPKPILVITAQNIVNENVNFNVTVNFNGFAIDNAMVTFNSINKETDAEGYAAFIAPSVDNDTLYMITASKTGYVDGTKTILVKNIPKQPALSITVEASPKTIESTGIVTIIMKVSSNNNSVEKASFTVSDNNSGGTFSTVTEIGNGEYSMTYTAPITTIQKLVIIKVTATKKGYDPSTNQTTIIVNPKAYSEFPATLYLEFLITMVLISVGLLFYIRIRYKKKYKTRVQKRKRE